jgi:PncC family amidohydrolase
MPFDPACNELSEKLGKILLQKHLFVSTAESCTGGLIGAAITAVAGSSQWFTGGIIAYDNSVKIRLLCVDEQIIARYGAVSEETVKAMALGAARVLKTDCSIAVSGIAGPQGGSAEKPAGLVYIGICSPGAIAGYRHQFDGGRELVRHQAVIAGLTHLITAIE